MKDTGFSGTCVRPNMDGVMVQNLSGASVNRRPNRFGPTRPIPGVPKFLNEIHFPKLPSVHGNLKVRHITKVMWCASCLKEVGTGVDHTECAWYMWRIQSEEYTRARIAFMKQSDPDVPKGATVDVRE